MSDRPPSPSTSARLRVLLVDYSVGFGGATKSIGLVTPAVPDLSLRVLTCQEPVEYHRWYEGRPVHVFRRVFNYQNLERVRDSLPTGPVGRLLGTAISASTLASNGWNAARLHSLLRRHPVDLIHLNNGFAPSEVLWVARRLRIPAVVHLRGFTTAEDVRAHANGVSQIVAVSRGVARAVHESGFPRERTPVIWDPVDLELMERARAERAGLRALHRVSDSEVAIGLFGRIVHWKGTREFVRACLAVLARGVPLRPVIVGDVSDGTARYLDEVRALVASSAFADRFVFTGYQPEPAGHYHAVDIVAHTSIEPEPFGMVVPEGMAAARPVIAAAAGGPLEVIDEGQDGFLTKPGDIDALAAAIERLARDPALRARLGAAGRRKAEERFSIATSAGALHRTWMAALAD